MKTPAILAASVLMTTGRFVANYQIDTSIDVRVRNCQ